MNRDSNVTIAMMEPEYPINLGYVARTMKNFDFYNLLLINPKIGIESSKQFSLHAFDILQNSKTVDFSYLKKFDSIIGTTAKPSKSGLNISRITLPVHNLKLKKHSLGKNICLLLGRESTGLDNHELKFCDFIINIPTSNSYSTMNISHALAIILYELNTFKYEPITVASKTMIERTISNYMEIAKLVRIQEHKIVVLETVFRRMLGNNNPTPKENSVLLGLASKIKLALRNQD